MNLPKIKVFLIDDSIVIRHKLINIFKSDDQIEVVGDAEDGLDALRKLRTIKPDVLILDIEMPKMSGLEFLKSFREINRDIPIIMFSSLTQHGAIATLDALAYGATDYVTKPTSLSDTQNTLEAASRLLLDKVRSLSKSNISQLAAAGDIIRKKINFVPKFKPKIIAIGASTGGPQALTKVFQDLPKDLDLPPIVIVVHMPAIFTQLFAERLAINMPVCEAKDGDVLKPGHAYVAPGNFHMELVKDKDQVVIRTNQNPPCNFCRPSVDVLFKTVANIYRDKTLAIMLTGMGSDGLEGTREIKASGGSVIIQDKATSVVWGMPGAVHDAGLADDVVSIDEVADKIIQSSMS